MVLFSFVYEKSQVQRWDLTLSSPRRQLLIRTIHQKRMTVLVEPSLSVALWLCFFRFVFNNDRQECAVRKFSLAFPFASTVTSAGIIDQCITEDPPSVDPQSSLAPPRSPTSPTHPQTHHLSVHMQAQRSLSTVSSIDPRSSSARNFSISSARRPSTFDGETQRVLERQQTQERLANIRTTFTLFIVTATFLVMYLPSIIHTLFRIKPYAFREVIFLLYYMNSAVRIDLCSRLHHSLCLSLSFF